MAALMRPREARAVSLCVGEQSSREPIEAPSPKATIDERKPKQYGDDTSECRPYLHKALKIGGARIATFQARHHKPCSRLDCDPNVPLTLCIRRTTSRLTRALGRLARSTLKTKKECSLDFQKIVSDLTAEKDRITRAIEALLESSSKRGPKKGVKRTGATGRRRGGMTPEGRRRLSLAMKKRWAERKRKKS